MTEVKVQNRKNKIGWLFRFLILSFGFWSIADRVLTPDVIQGPSIAAGAGHWAFFRGQKAYRAGLSINTACKKHSFVTSRGCYTGYLSEKFKKTGIKSWKECSQTDKTTCSIAAGIAWAMNNNLENTPHPTHISTWSVKNLKFFFEGLGFGSYMKKGFNMAIQHCNQQHEYKPYCLFGVGQYSFFKYRPVIFNKTPKEIFWGSRLALYEFDSSLHQLQGYLDLPTGKPKPLTSKAHKSVLDCLKGFHDLDCIPEKTRPSDI